MLLFDMQEIGNKLLTFRKQTGMTQSELADAAEISGRTYADIERGTVNMRLTTLMRICRALHITPDEILTDDSSAPPLDQKELIARLNHCAPKDRETALRLLTVYLQSLSEPQIKQK